MLPHFVSEIGLCDKVNHRFRQLDVVILQRSVLQDIPANLAVCIVTAGTVVQFIVARRAERLRVP